MIESFFYSHPIFRYAEFANWKAKHGTDNPRTIKSALQYYLKTGRLLNIRQGLYAVLPPTELANTDNFFIDPYLISATITEDGILAYHTALELHGIAYTAFDRFTFLTNKKIKPFEFQNHWFQTSSIPRALKNRDPNFGVEYMTRQELEIKVTNLERTFVDVLDRIELSGGWEEVVRSISRAAALDIGQVIEYCLMLKNNTLSAKVGFFLEQRTGAFSVNDSLLEQLLMHKPLTPQFLAHAHQRCKLIKKWNLILPTEVINQSWEEPNYDV